MAERQSREEIVINEAAKMRGQKGVISLIEDIVAYSI